MASCVPQQYFEELNFEAAVKSAKQHKLLSLKISCYIVLIYNKGGFKLLQALPMKNMH